MKQIVATVTGRGQVTLPAEVRRLLGARKGDKVLFSIDDDGEIQIGRPKYPDIESIRGVAGTLKTPLTWQEILEIAHEDRALEIVRKLT